MKNNKAEYPDLVCITIEGQWVILTPEQYDDWEKYKKENNKENEERNV